MKKKTKTKPKKSAKKKPKISIIGLILLYIIAFFAMITLVFLPAGTFKWIEAWIYIIIQFSFSGLVAVWLIKHDPALLKKRMSKKLPEKWWDKLFGIGFIISTLALFLIMGLDAKRYNWSDIPVAVEIIAFLFVIISLYAIFLTMKENTYLSMIVEIQKKRRQKVITTGPYARVRHPMYVAMLVLFFSIPIALGSLYGLIPSAAILVFTIFRTYLEDITLQKELKGYKAYTKKTRYRLLPGVW